MERDVQPVSTAAANARNSSPGRALMVLLLMHMGCSVSQMRMDPSRAADAISVEDCDADGRKMAELMFAVCPYSE